jgi:creatinine amidohydrolase
MKFPSYRDRYLPAMTPRRIRALPDKAWAPVILATGAIEQHGPHLPVAVDAFMGQVWLSLALSRLPAGASCYVAPPITIGKSNEHTGFAGTLMISRDTLRSQILAVARQVHSWGFRSLASSTRTAATCPLSFPTLREIRALYGLRAGLLQSRPVDGPLGPGGRLRDPRGRGGDLLDDGGGGPRLDRPVEGRVRIPGADWGPWGGPPGGAPALQSAWASRDVSSVGDHG